MKKNELCILQFQRIANIEYDLHDEVANLDYHELLLHIQMDLALLENIGQHMQNVSLKNQRKLEYDIFQTETVN